MSGLFCSAPSQTKATCLPSGDKAGWVSWPGKRVIGTIAAPTSESLVAEPERSEKTVEPDTCRADQHEDQGNCDRRLSMAMFDRRFGPRLPVAHGRDEAVTVPGQGLDPARAALPEGLAKRGDLERQIRFFDERVGPQRSRRLLFRDSLAVAPTSNTKRSNVFGASGIA